MGERVRSCYGDVEQVVGDSARLNSRIRKSVCDVSQIATYFTHAFCIKDVAVAFVADRENFAGESALRRRA